MKIEGFRKVEDYDKEDGSSFKQNIRKDRVKGAADGWCDRRGFVRTAGDGTRGGC